MSDILDKFTGEQEIININMKLKNMKKIVNGLYIVATPIGNLDDISKRAIDTIKLADIVVCENPKHSLKLLNNIGIKKKLVPLHDYNEKLVIQKMSNKLKNAIIVLISDSGSPLISDPGFKLVQHCIIHNIYITTIPGCTSIIPSLQLSGLPINEFSFIGFFPKSKKLVSDFIKKVEISERTIVFLVSSHKVEYCLNLLSDEIPDREISIAKELTKYNEKVFRGFCRDIKNKIVSDKKNLKGEFVVVVGEKVVKKREFTNLKEYNNQIIKLLSKFSLTDVVEIVHKLTGITKNKIYKWVLSLKKH